VLNGAGAGDLGEGEDLLRGNLDRGRDLPASAQVARRAGAGALGRLAASPLAPVKFSGLIDRVLALDSRDRSPTPVVMPLNGCAGAGACWARGVVVANKATKAIAASGMAAGSSLDVRRMGTPVTGWSLPGTPAERRDHCDRARERDPR
jgi:hypothetical protein